MRSNQENPVDYMTNPKPLNMSRERELSMLSVPDRMIRRCVAVECEEVFDLMRQLGVRVPANNLHAEPA